jgi:uncharacterized membrane protein
MEVKMSRIRFQSKANGLMTLRGKWLKAIIIFMLMVLLVLGFNEIDQSYRAAFGSPQFLSDGSLNISQASLIIEAVFAFVVLLFLPPLFTGQTEWYWGLTEAKKKGIGDVFGWFGSFKLYIKSVGLAFNIFVRCLLWAILTCSVPVGILWADFYYFPPNFSLAALNAQAVDYNTTVFCMLAAFAGLLLLGALFLLCLIIMRYFLAVFLMVEDNRRSVREVVRTSLSYSKGQRWGMLVFCMSFALWFVSLFLWLPALFVLPYFNASASVYAKHIIFTRRAKDKSIKAQPADITVAEEPAKG